MDDEEKLLQPQPKNDFWKNPTPTNENPNFVRDYFASSRLHFIGSFRARYESMMVAVGRKLGVNPSQLLQSSAEKGLLAAKRNPAERVIVHVDMDCFFASISVKKNPSLAGKCIAVCHGGGEISSCSYEARKFGVHAGMFFRNARRLCPDLQSVPYEFSLYEEASIHIYATFYSYPGVCVEAVSVDEAFLDLSLAVGDDAKGSQSAAEALVQSLRSSIFAKTGCTASAGIGPSKLVARLATKAAKPNGQIRIRQERIIEYLDTLAVKDLPGIGWRTSKRLADLAVHTCPQLRAMPLSTLQSEFGERQGQVFHDMSRALDSRLVQPLKPRKSIGAEVSWGVRFEKEEGTKVKKFISDMTDEVSARVIGAGAHGAKVTYKVYKKKPNSSMAGWKHLGHGPCTILTKSGKIPSSRSNAALKDSLREVCLRLHEDLGVRNEELRGVGLQMTDLFFADLNLDFTAGPTAGSTKRIESFFDAAPSTQKGDTHSAAKPQAELELGQIAANSTGIEEKVGTDQNLETLKTAVNRNVEIESHVASDLDEIQPERISDEDKIEAVKVNDVPVSSPLKRTSPAHLPTDWDKSVFRALPEELRRELLASSDVRRIGIPANLDDGEEDGNRHQNGRRTLGRKRRKANARRVARQAMGERRGRSKQTEQVTMTQFADISELKVKGHDVLDAEEFQQKPLRECVELLEDLRGKRRKTPALTRSAQNALQGGLVRRESSGRSVSKSKTVAEESNLDIPSPPSLSSDSDGGQSIAALIQAQSRDHEQLYEEENIVDYAVDLKIWMLDTAEDIKTGHVELLRGRVLEFVQMKKLERVCSEMRVIKRFAESDGMGGWRQCYNRLVDDVQFESQQLYGFSLALQRCDV